MSQETQVVVCSQCGKKYQLKADFDAASFQCKGCAATVWVKKKPAEVQSSQKRRAGGGGGGRARAGARGASGGKRRAGASAKRGRARQEESVEEERPGRARYQKKKDNTPMIIGGVSVVALAIVGILMMNTEKKEDAPAGPGAGETMSGTTDAIDPPPEDTGAAGGAAVAKTTGDAGAGMGATDPGAAAGEEKGTGKGAEAGEDTPRPTRKLGGGSKRNYKRSKTSKWDAPIDIPHLKETTKEDRERIDYLVTTMMDPDMGIDSMRAKDELVLFDKKSFPRVLAAMARIRDTMTDVDSFEERLVESSLRLGDSCLREMDGYLNNYNKSELRPGTTKRYTAYILRLHYKRWKRVLIDLPKMPGPFDPSSEFEEPENFQGK